MIAMPVGIEQDFDRVRVRIGDCLLQLKGAIGVATVDHQQTAFAYDETHVSAIAAQQHDAVGKFGCLNGSGRCLAETETGDRQPRGPTAKLSEEMTAIEIQLRHTT